MLTQLPPVARRNLFNIDQPRYLSIAQAIRHDGLFTNGREAAAIDNAADGRPGAAVAPLYPALIAAFSTVDPVLREAERCVAHAPDAAGLRACSPALGSLVPVQIALAVVTLLLTWRLALAVTGDRWASWCALLIAGFGTGQYASFACTAMTEALIAPLMALYLLGLVHLVRGGGAEWALAGGAALGLSMLTRPEFEAIAWLELLTGAAWLLRYRPAGWVAVSAGVALAITLPWRLRNLALFGHAQITIGYGGFVLAQRLAYQAMRWPEWCASFPYALPGFGPALARWLFGAANVARLGWEERPDTFYVVGNTAGIAALAQAVPDPARQVGYLLRTAILPHLPWYGLVSLSIAWKGLFVRKFIALPGLPCLLALLIRGWRKRAPGAFAMAGPPLAMAALYGASSVGTPRYNLDLVPCYAVACGAMLSPAVRRRGSGASR